MIRAERTAAPLSLVAGFHAGNALFITDWAGMPPIRHMRSIPLRVGKPCSWSRRSRDWPALAGGWTSTLCSARASGGETRKDECE
jgi:hypothetical protein